ncbi:MAG: hypothetical protein HUJ63_10525 [Enterococcus sp.]|nr:hypothetical protein [Enterococcus sp.]
MTVKELSREQLVRLKQKMLDDEIYEKEGRGASYGELATADKLVADDAVFAEYANTDFTEEDL